MKTKELTIFVVDDSPVALNAVTAALQQTIHCNVKGFTSAEDCLYRMENWQPDIILSDYYLDALYERKINGDQMLSRIKRKYPGIPVIMYSAENNVEVVIRLMKLGAVDFIPKEDDFIKNISEMTLTQLKKLKLDNESRSGLWIFALTFSSIIIMLAMLHVYSPDSVVYVIIGILLLLCAWAFAASKRSPQQRHYGNVP